MRKLRKHIATAILAISSFQSEAQEIISRNLPYDPNEHKLIPDKVFEIGVPALLLFLLLNAIIAILKGRADVRLKQQMIERGVSEETLIAIFRESNAIAKLQPLKYALYAFSLALSFAAIHLFRTYLSGQSGYLAVGIILFFTSAASYAYYLLLQRRH